MKIKISPFHYLTHSLFLVAVVFFLPQWSVASLPVADTVLKGGVIYTVDSQSPWAEAVAIKEGKILWVGKNSEVTHYIGTRTKVTDLQGKFVMPGIIDAHLHPTWGGLKLLYKCNFKFDATPAFIVKKLKSCIEKSPSLEWIIGGQWGSNFFENHDLKTSPREWLDKISTKHAIVLKDDTGHNHWVNSKALKLIGIDRTTPNPEGGTIVHDQQGEPNGLLLENVRLTLAKVIPEYVDDQYRHAAKKGVLKLNSLGVTGFKDATASVKVIKAYHKLDSSKELNAWVSSCYDLPRAMRQSPLNITPIVATIEKYNTSQVNTRCVKYYLDGVPTAARSAAMLAPYLQNTRGHGKKGSGTLLRNPKIFVQELTAFDKQGITAKIHASGDRSIRVALNAIETVRKANGDSGLMHELAHAMYVDPVDIPRFAELGAVADMAPALWFPSPVIDAVVGVLGKRGKDIFPFRDMLDNGVRITAGSDWPSGVLSPTPWTGIEAMVTRQNPSSDFPGELWPEQAVTLDEAITIYTLNGAKSLGFENLTGSLEIGKSADFIVLDRNLFKVPVESISDTRVISTWFQGKRIYKN